MTITDEIIEREHRFLLPTYNRYPIALERGKGVFLYDREGNRYLDFVAGLGVNALGHAHPRVVKAIREQSARAIHFSNLYYHEFQGRLAEKLCHLSGLNRAFFSNSAWPTLFRFIALLRVSVTSLLNLLGQGISIRSIRRADNQGRPRPFGFRHFLASNLPNTFLISLTRATYARTSWSPHRWPGSRRNRRLAYISPLPAPQRWMTAARSCFC